MSLERIDTIINHLKEGTYQWKPVKRTYRPKKGKKKGKRPLGLPGWQDKMVQEVSRMVLEAYYEPQFSDKSHGFRPGRGCHTALAEIRDTWKGTKWFIEGDIQGCFDNLDQNLLLDIIGRDIQDKRFLKLIRGMLKAGYMEDWKYHETYSGAPQGGIASPILANIYLNELDKFVENELIPQYTSGKLRKDNPEYQRLTRQIAKAREAQDIEEYRRLQKRRREIPRGHPQDPNYRRLRYCRYADDFLLGFTGPRSEALEIKEKIRAFLQTIKLTLSEEKTLITSATKGKARFLGYDLHVTIANSRITTHTIAGTTTRIKRRATNGRVILSVPQEVAQAWKNRYTQKGKPIHRKELTNNSDYEIVMTFNAEFQGLVNYYTLAHNVSTRLYPVKYHYLQSVVKTLARKHRKPATWVYRNYYQTSEHGVKAIVVTIPRKVPKKPLVAQFGAKPIRCVKQTIIKDEKPKPIYTGRNEIVQRLLADECELCGAKEKTEGHHIRKIADIKKKYKGRKQPPKWAVFMIERNRKAIMVCKTCHQAIHSGKYDGPKLA
jgi:group II intron reverse transcriptase/maturase